MRFTKIARTEEIPPGTMKSFKIKSNSILVANVGGHYYAIDNECTHAGVGLSKGKLEGTVVTCAMLGSQFDLTNGARLKGPAYRRVPVYEVEIDADFIKVKI